MAAQQHITHLLDKYLDNSHTPADYQELLAYFDIAAHETEAEALLYKAIGAIESYPSVSTERMERVTSNAFDTLQQRIGRTHQPSLIRRLLPYAAAAILLFLSVGIYWYIQQNEFITTPVLTSEFGDDALPGGNRAYITLSDGRRIALDSTQSGLSSSNGKHVYADGAELLNSSDAEYATVSTPIGGEYEVTLPDGTRAWLNANSSLKYPTEFVGGERRVETTGEVYLEVASNKAKPFIVQSQGQEIRVLGTAFNIRSYKASTITTLVHGKIALTPSGTNKQTVLTPGNQAVLSGTGLRVSDVDPMDYTAWRDGIILNKDASLQEICQELERWYGVRFIFPVGFDNSERAIISIDRNEKLSSFLAALRNSYRVAFEIKGKEVYVR
ncbi:FecR family protein [Sphingobacterium nematocida]|uniref:FecR family protein n=1 Tax=Sphingobacterium nematocida TaxID=1513896 RepID=A0A1T5GQH4_9SPHI|nr:FecR family protein [Sphingobacterium nematocida]SKC10637.1 FecR family protein [Sphingobacterium nematocida]